MFTRKEIGLLVTGYTGVGCSKFSEFHTFAEETLGRPIQTLELADTKVWEELKEKLKPQFLAFAQWCAEHDETVDGAKALSLMLGE